MHNRAKFCRSKSNRVIGDMYVKNLILPKAAIPLRTAAQNLIFCKLLLLLLNEYY